jgi:hypothetical protein
MDDKLEIIHKKLDALEKEHNRKEALLENRKDKAREIARFIMDFVKTIDPDRIGVVCYGSLDNIGVSNSLEFRINAVIKTTMQTIYTWTIDGRGKIENREWSGDQIMHVITESIKDLKE